MLLTKFHFVEQVQNKPVRCRRSRQQIQELLNLFANSNVSVKDFCSTHNISTCNFHKWKSRYKSNLISREKLSGFATIDVADALPALPGLFAEVKGIKIFQPVSACYLKELLA